MLLFVFCDGRVVAKARNYEGSAKFRTHFNGREKAAVDYKNDLPEGMVADPEYEAWLKTTPWPPLTAVSKIG